MSAQPEADDWCNLGPEPVASCPACSWAGPELRDTVHRLLGIDEPCRVCDALDDAAYAVDRDRYAAYVDDLDDGEMPLGYDDDGWRTEPDDIPRRQ